MTVGSSINGFSLAACANFEENSPKFKCCDFFSISPDVAISQKAVEPPLPSTTSYPSGRLNNEFKPVRTRFTTLLTGFWRCEVPSIDCDLIKVSRASGRIFEGPQPKRPSLGFKFSGILISLMNKF